MDFRNARGGFPGSVARALVPYPRMLGAIVRRDARSSTHLSPSILSLNSTHDHKGASHHLPVCVCTNHRAHTAQSNLKLSEYNEWNEWPTLARGDGDG